MPQHLETCILEYFLQGNVLRFIICATSSSPFSSFFADMMSYRIRDILPTCVLVTLMTSMVLGDFSHTCDVDDFVRPSGVCGNHLADLLSIICGGSYNHGGGLDLIYHDKRSSDLSALQSEKQDSGKLSIW